MHIGSDELTTNAVNVANSLFWDDGLFQPIVACVKMLLVELSCDGLTTLCHMYYGRILLLISACYSM